MSKRWRCRFLFPYRMLNPRAGFRLAKGLRMERQILVLNFTITFSNQKIIELTESIDFDTLPLNSDRLSGPSGMSIFVMITFLPLDSVIASNIKLIVL